ncbi:hypothetical protein L218DRAFT_666821 [Marasmius fiardii PR-910]|nr:hypothetical protein L218DRAFT_666821 [Marasmius fiardii PR-910]
MTIDSLMDVFFTVMRASREHTIGTSTPIYLYRHHRPYHVGPIITPFQKFGKLSSSSFFPSPAPAFANLGFPDGHLRTRRGEGLFPFFCVIRYSSSCTRLARLRRVGVFKFVFGRKCEPFHKFFFFFSNRKKTRLRVEPTTRSGLGLTVRYILSDWASLLEQGLGLVGGSTGGQIR